MTSFKKFFCEIFELPEEVVLNQPLLMLTGNSKIFIENHRGIAIYEEDRIVIRINEGQLIVKGGKLEIINISGKNININGDITSLSYETSRENIADD